jgi:hypothetical protein
MNICDVIHHHLNPNSEKWKAFLEREKIERCGTGNPMYGRMPWNKDKTKETNKILQQIANKLRGRKASDSTRKKLSEGWKKRAHIPGHSKPHTEEAKRKMSLATLKRIKEGRFKHLRSGPHIKFVELLKQLQIPLS